jgi:hypothetical protein
LRAKRSNPEAPPGKELDCFVAALLAMTALIEALNPEGKDIYESLV